MLNQVILVGRIISLPKEDKKGLYSMQLAAQNGYKNEQGEYDTNFIKLYLSKTIAQPVIDYCKIGDSIGARGSIRRLTGEKTRIVIEKVIYLSTNHKENAEE